jgi:hypothetical protein
MWALAKERSDHMKEGTGTRLLGWGVGIFILMAILAFPAMWTAKGMSFADDARRKGIAVDVPPKLDGFGFSAKATQDALDKKVTFNDELYEKMTRGGDLYIRKEYSVGEGLSGFFFGLGVRMAN